MHTYIHTYILIYIHTYIYTYIHDSSVSIFIYSTHTHTHTHTHTNTQVSDEIAFHAACTSNGEEGGARKSRSQEEVDGKHGAFGTREGNKVIAADVHGRDLPEELMRRMTTEDMSMLGLARTAYIAAERSSEVCFTVLFMGALPHTYCVGRLNTVLIMFCLLRPC